MYGGEEIDRVASFRRSAELHPVSKTAQMLSRELHRKGEIVEAMAWAGLAYALNPRHDQAATHLASLLAENAQPERAWEIVAETLSRNSDYGPAWKLLEQLEGIRSSAGWAHETIESLKEVAPSLGIDDALRNGINEALSDRLPLNSSGIDWTKAIPLAKAELGFGYSGSVREFIEDAIAQLELGVGDRVLLIADHVFDETLSLQIGDLEASIEKLIQLPLGFLFGPVDGSWDWVIDVRFSGHAWAGRPPEVTK